MSVYPAASVAWTFWYRARLASVSLISCPAAMTCAAVGGAVVPYIFMSGRPEVDPISPMPDDPDDPDDADDPEPDGDDAMAAGPSGPAQPGVITAVVAAITAAGTASMAATAAKALRRRTGRSARDGRHRSAAHPAIRVNSRIPVTTSRPPTGSGWCTSGPIGRPVLRDATYTARTRAFPAMPSDSHSRDGRHTTAAAQIIWAQEMMRKNTPYSTYSL